MNNGARYAIAAAVVAVLGLVGVSSATAANEMFHSEKEPTVITANNTGEGTHVFEIEDGGPKVTCNVATFAGTMAKNVAATLTVHPTYSDCKTNLGENASIKTAGCNYVIHAEELLNGMGELHGDTELECAGTNELQVITPSCTIFFGTQKTADGSAYANGGEAATRYITFKMTDTLTFIKKIGVACFALKGDALIYHGSFIGKGYEDKGGPKNEDEYTEGGQVGIWWQ